MDGNVENAQVSDQVVDTPQDVNAPEESSTSEQTQSNGSETEQPQVDKVENRYQKLANANKQMKMQLRQFQESQREYDGAIKLHNWINGDPKKAQILLDLMNGKATANAEPEKDPYADYDPDIAEKFRKLDQLEQWKLQQEQEREQSFKSAEINHQQTIDQQYDQLLIADGFLKKDGSPVDESLVDIVSLATKAYLDSIAKNPSMPTQNELQAAYKVVKQSMAYVEKTTLKRSATPASVPATGSRSGMPVSQPSQGANTDQERVASVVAYLQNMK
jgi:hypothetical protein